MQFKKVIGKRRSSRDYSDRPVEMEKIQIILEAARLAPCASNLNILRAVVVERNKTPQRLIDSIAEFNRNHILQAPILVCWYVDMQAWKDRAERMKELIDVGALKPEYGWSHDYIEGGMNINGVASQRAVAQIKFFTNQIVLNNKSFSNPDLKNWENPNKYCLELLNKLFNSPLSSSLTLLTATAILGSVPYFNNIWIF